jgi:protein SCO1/2
VRPRLAAALIPLAGLLALLAVPGPALAGPDGVAPASNVPAPRPESRIDEKIGEFVPLDTEFRDENDQPITLRQCIAGKPTILLPMYYRCPVLCNNVLNGLIEALQKMPPDYTAGGKFNIVTVSIDPKEHAGLAAEKKKNALKEYGREGAENGWHFLTGSKEAIAELTGAVGYVYMFDKAYKEYAHPAGIVILTPEGKISRYFYGIAFDRTFEVQGGGTTTLRWSLIEASEGKIGSPLERLIMTCYRFDNLTGYSFSVVRAVQIGGVLTLLVIVAGVTVALVRERRTRATPATETSATTAAPAADAPAAPTSHDEASGRTA